MPDISVQKLICEPTICDLKVGDVIQFERFAFCRLDEIRSDATRVFWFTHE
jgi:hypothetical protein